MEIFAATREAGLQRLWAWLPNAGPDYTQWRNHDRGPGEPATVSRLAPWLRHRLLTEQEVVRAVLQQFTYPAAEKFIQEVCWRTYWKDWLQSRPGIWRRYLESVAIGQTRMQDDADLAHRYRRAVSGATGLDCLDCWARELVASGYLHNHVRMWFASIWIFTLRLPWALGADFFLTHLLDGDAASNTLSWRWVAGLHTRGKHYLARADNIRRYTNGRFNPTGQLDESAPALEPDEPAPPAALPAAAPSPLPGVRTVLLLAGHDLYPESLALAGARPATVVGVSAGEASGARSILARTFADEALNDGVQRASTHFDVPATRLAPPDLVAWLVSREVKQLVLAELPVGPERDSLAEALAEADRRGIRVVPMRRPWDGALWPHAGRGFFTLRERIPDTLQNLGLL